MKKIIFALAAILIVSFTGNSQTPEFTYQGRLVDGSLAAHGTYEMRFRLFDAETGGEQQPQPTPITLDFTVAGSNPVAVTNGVFTVKLDFTSAAFPGAARFLEISVRRNAVDPFTLLNPRQPVTSSPHSIKSLNADTANTATNSMQLGGVNAAQYVVTTDARMNDARPPTAGSSDYIQNRTTQQELSNFNVSGTGTASIFDAGTQFNIGGSRVLSSGGTLNLFAGHNAGNVNTGFNNAFFGTFAGSANTGGSVNAFFGTQAGQSNVSGSENSFFGYAAGVSNQTGCCNSFFGRNAGSTNTNGQLNSFFGTDAGDGNISGSNNTFVGVRAGESNVGGSNNTMLGFNAKVLSPNLSFATAIGSGATVNRSSQIVLGRSGGQDAVFVPGSATISNGLTTNTTITGLLGVGTAAPTQPLHVAGNALITGTVFADQFYGGGDGLFNVAGTFKWQEVSGTSQQAERNNGYVATSNTQVTITLPGNLGIGDIVRISGIGAGGWKIAQNDGQTVLGINIGLLGANWTARENSRSWFSVASSADGGKLVAPVYNGQIYTSADSGASWTPSESNRQWGSSTSSADGNKLVAAVENGQIYTSADSGANWTARESNRNWYSVASSADGSKLVAVVFNGQIYTSNNSGVNWTPREATRQWHAVASSADGSNLVAVVFSGQIYTSTDSGANWTPRESNRRWRAVASSADGSKLVALTDDERIYVSANSGITWTPRESSRQWWSVATSADGTKVVATVINGQIYASADSGTSWTPRESNRQWAGIASSSDGRKLVAVEIGGRIYTSLSATTIGTAGFLTGGQFSAIELQYIGNGQFLPLTFTGAISGN